MPTSTLYADLLHATASSTNEAELRDRWSTNFTRHFGIVLELEKGKTDARHHQLIIEFKAPGLFKGSADSAKFKEAVDDRLKKYIPRQAKESGLEKSDYVGIATDGKHFSICQWHDNKVAYGPLLALTSESVELLEKAVKASNWRAITPTELLQDFGHASKAGPSLMQAMANALADCLADPDSNKVKMLFEEWRAFYGQVADLSAAKGASIVKHLGFKLVTAPKDVLPASLFVIHTYNALVMKLLAAEVVATHKLTAYTKFSQNMLALGDMELLDAIDLDIERAGFFSGAGIQGFVEEAIFSWYLDAAKEPKHTAGIVAGLRSLHAALALYRADTLSVARTSDVFKQFYQDLVPEELRKSLGEFYTPDWLVELTLDQTRTVSWLDVRTLDPTCGSGSFPLAVIRRMRNEAAALGMAPAELLTRITANVWGFDLNPLAVQTARVNYLVSIADLLQTCPGHKLTVPILLADAVYSPARKPLPGETTVKYTIGSHIAKLDIEVPAVLANDRARLDNVLRHMEREVERDHEWDVAQAAGVAARAFTTSEAELWAPPLKHTYDQVLRLHRKKWNGIWFRIVRNFFWSANAGAFDVVAGNPPWVRWSSLPELYRERVKPTCQAYSIFAKTKFHGGNELDISGMITYTASDKWLKTGGTLAFVITQTHFQSPSSSSFRLFDIDGQHKLVPVSVDDMKLLKPFADAANKTAVFIARKVHGGRIDYPIDYRVWEAAPGMPRAIPVELDLPTVLARTKRDQFDAQPVVAAELDTPWAVLPKGMLATLAHLTGKSSWVQGRKGITVDLNAVYYVKVLSDGPVEGLVHVQVQPESGKKTKGMPALKAWIEPDLLYPLLKGAADFSACSVHRKQGLFAIVPNKGIRVADLDAGETAMAALPETTDYFRRYTALLKDRATYKQRLAKREPYVIYNVGDYTFAPHKVVWAEMPGQGKFFSAVVSDAPAPGGTMRPLVPDHKVFFVDFQDETAAHYLCGLLNSKIVCTFITSYSIAIQVGNIFKHMSLPQFVPGNKDHELLSGLSKLAHKTRSGHQRVRLLKLIDLVASRILSGMPTERPVASLSACSDELRG
jgi:hypothetical protein